MNIITKKHRSMEELTHSSIQDEWNIRFIDDLTQ